MILTMGKREFEMDSPKMGWLRDSTDVRDNYHALRDRMEEDGYVFIRKLHDPEKVRKARMVMVNNLNAGGRIDTDHPIEDGVIKEGQRGSFLGGHKAITHHPDFLALVEAPELMEFYAKFLDGPSLTYDFKWLRCMGQGDWSTAHYDIPYMGRGTLNVYTLWTPLGNVPLNHGPLAIVHGSNRWEKIKATYGKMDVDRDHVRDNFSSDPYEVVDKFGGRWLTSNFEMGDAIFFGMFMMHGSLDNTVNRFRLSTDTRYQRADEPVDERWVGENPIAHYGWFKGETISMAEAREKWGI